MNFPTLFRSNQTMLTVDEMHFLNVKSCDLNNQGKYSEDQAKMGQYCV